MLWEELKDKVTRLLFFEFKNKVTRWLFFLLHIRLLFTRAQQACVAVTVCTTTKVHFSLSKWQPLALPPVGPMLNPDPYTHSLSDTPQRPPDSVAANPCQGCGSQPSSPSTCQLDFSLLFMIVRSHRVITWHLPYHPSSEALDERCPAFPVLLRAFLLFSYYVILSFFHLLFDLISFVLLW